GMRNSLVRLVRKNWLTSMFGGGSKTTAVRKELSEAQREKLKSYTPSLTDDSKKGRAGKGTSVSSFVEESEQFLSDQFDKDQIRARGFLPYMYNYNPPKDIANTIEGVAKELLQESGKKFDSDSVRKFEFERDNELKFELISRVAEEVSHWPKNSHLVHFDTIEDVIQFYQQPIHNITHFQKMARAKNLPKNISILEDAVRFHPEDTHLWHGGVTAFPGQGGQVVTLRNKRLYREFRPKEEWYEYEEENFDYTPVDKGMPWDPEITKKMDSIGSKRYSLARKGFIGDSVTNTGYTVDLRDSPFKDQKKANKK
ncbi:hypothetical protein WR25_21358, partial [Diploscapter pachys]